MRRNAVIYGVVAIIFAGTGAFFGLRQLTPAEAQPAAAAAMFAQTLSDASGQPHQMAQWKGKPLVVNFWATWCAPCVDEMPELSELQQQVREKNIQILGIGIDSPKNIAEFATKYKISYPLYAAGMTGTELSRQFGNQHGGLPFTALITKYGEIKKTYLGRLKMEELRQDLTALQ